VDAAIAAATRDLANDIPANETSWRRAPSARLVIYGEGTPTLAYHVQLRVAGKWIANMEYAIDARTGAVLGKYDDIQTITGTGTGVLGDTKTLQISQANGGYSLVDSTRTPNGISTYDAQNGQNTPGTLESSTTTSTWDTQSTAPGAAVDAHYYAGLVYDYYKTHHNRLSIDGNNGAIVSSVHFQSNYDNAFWDGTQMTYGDGDGTQFRAFSASLDVVGHELTHGVTQNTSALVYNQQSGALNEATSDIFGTFVEHTFKPDPVKNWLLGEDLSLQGRAFRDMIHPANGMQPANMSQLVTTTQDNGGVHTNSGIVNNAMYLMTMGGTNDVSRIQVQRGIGWDQSEKLWYRAAFHYFMSTTNFAGAATATKSAATDLNFTTDEQSIVECAWIATGVITGTCKPLGTNPPPSPDGGTPPGADAGPGGDPPPPSGGADASAGDPSPSPSPSPSSPDAGTSSNNGGAPRHWVADSASTCSVHAVGSGGSGAAAIVLALAALARRRRK
jgi:thermolysin